MSHVLAGPSRLVAAARGAGLAVSLAGAAAALWALAASAHVVGWEGRLARRLVFVPPPWLLAALVAAAVLLALGLSRFGAIGAAGAGRVAALRWLWLLLLPYLPWAPAYLSQGLLFDGPLAWVLCGAVALAVAGQDVDWRGLVSRLPVTQVAQAPRWLAVAIVAAAYAAAGWHATQLGPGGDEPHYLVISQSLWADGDLRIENQHRERQYGAFFRGEIRPHFLKRGVDDIIYSIHAPGLPVLSFPAYAVGGYRGVLLWLAIVAAIGTAAMFDVACRVGGREVAWLTTLALACSIPFAPHAWLFFPEMPAATLVALGVAWLWDDERPRSATTWLWRGALLGLLPWLHTKFVVMLAGLLLGLAWRLWPRLRELAALVLLPTVSGALWLYSFYVMYGVADPTVSYGDASTTVQLAWSNVPRGVLGLIVDQEFGLLLYSPVLLLAPLGGWYLVARREWRVPTLVVMGTAAAFVVAIGRVYMWWGGWSVPGRFLVPVLPLVCPLLAGLLAAWAGTWRARVAGVLVAWGLLALVWTGAEPARQLMFNTRDGTGRWLAALEGSAALTTSWPSYLDEDWNAEWPRTLALGAGLLVFGLSVALWERRWPSHSFAAALPRTIGLGLAALGATAGLAIGEADRQRVATNGAMDALGRRVSSSFDAVDPDRFIRVPTPSLLQRLALRLPAAAPEPRYGRVAGPFDLPAGRYDLRAWAVGRQLAVPDQTALRLEYHTRDGVVAMLRGPRANPAGLTFDLPVALDDLWVTVDSRRAPRFATIDIVPRALAPAPAALGPPYSIWPLDGAAGTFVVGLDDGYYAEGSGGWIRGEREAGLLLVGGRPSRVRVRVFNGPVAQEVRVSIAGHARRISLGAGAASAVEHDVAGDGQPVRVVVAAASGFRPRDHDRSTRDGRWLGCRIQIDGS